MRYFFNYVCQMNSIRQFVILLVILVLGSSFTKAQSTYLPINSFTNYYMDRLDLSGNSNSYNTSLKPYTRKDVSEKLDVGMLNWKWDGIEYIADDNF